MKTQPIHPPSSIEVLSDVMLLAYDDNDKDIAEAISNICLPIFRSELNLTMALVALKISHESANARDICDRYLDAIRGLK